MIMKFHIQRIEIVKGMRVTPILGAYHLPANERPKTTALVKWSKKLSKLEALTQRIIWVRESGMSVRLIRSQTYNLSV